jgi:hypothetical protein
MGMKRKGPAWLSDILPDSLTDLWKLLSETSAFLSRTDEFYMYEQQLRSLRSRLQNSAKDTGEKQAVRAELIDLRKNLRLQGYDLSVARQKIICDGFRNDSCLAGGFRRVVLFFTNIDIFWQSGDDNHVVLAGFIERRLEKIRDRSFSIFSKHYLWYRRKGNDLILSGADTERKEDFERLKKIVDLNHLKILAALKKLR